MTTKTSAPTKAPIAKPPTKAAVPPPAKANRPGFLGANLEAPKVAAENMTEKLKDMNFKVNESFHRRYKATAAAHGMQMKDVLEESFEMWLKARNSA